MLELFEGTKLSEPSIALNAIKHVNQKLHLKFRTLDPHPTEKLSLCARTDFVQALHISQPLYAQLLQPFFVKQEFRTNKNWGFNFLITFPTMSHSMASPLIKSK